MEYIYPNFYKKFRCNADKCNDTCCAGWAICIDNDALNRYKKYKGAFGNRLKNSINWSQSFFKQYKSRCAFLNDNNLCDIYSEAGKEMLCKTCKRYPRHFEEYENVREISLSMSCPVAAKLILTNIGKLSFIHKSDSKYEEYKDFDNILFSKLCDARDVIFNIISNKSVNIRLRMAAILSFSHDIQRRIDDNNVFDIDNVILKYSDDNFFIKFERQLQKKCSNNIYDKKSIIKELLKELTKLEILNKDWKLLIENALLLLNDIESSKYILEDSYIEQLLYYFVYTYYVGAVYDNNQYSKVIFSIYSVLMINEILGLYVLKNSKVTFENVVDISHRFAREIEHSDNNLNYLEKEFMDNDIFNIKKIEFILNV